MKPEHPLTELTAFDLGYICGLIVGEGSFTGDKRIAALAVKMHEDDPEPMRYLLRVLGGNMYGPYHHGDRRYYVYRLTGRPLREFLPYLDRHLPNSRKLEQFEVWLDRYDLRDCLSAD